MLLRRKRRSILTEFLLIITSSIFKLAEDFHLDGIQQLAEASDAS
jgi:hypothetical protein